VEACVCTLGDARRTAVEGARRKVRHKTKAQLVEVRRARLAAQLALATRLYGERSGDAFARRAVAELRDELPAPEDAGPYHASTVAADALAELDAHARPLLRAWLQRLRNLDALRDPDPET
ncbi:MAG: hypothetical protein AAF645_22540, partial [Myxococcota bacterium]